ncbi:hypothetical protein ACM64Y_19170 [Novispirillum sp. DQ9]|uniref:hypothetical protein n=1 Tax=Novispirillum sp. DQ9 TaxID=3398612 RepID=UPI003C7D3865
MDWDTSTEQGRRSLIAAFILTLLIAGPLVLLNESDRAALSPQSAMADILAPPD